MEGPVTIQLISVCFVVASVAVAITLWAVVTFQTKAEAKVQESRLKNDIEDVHKHLTAMRLEAKDDIRVVQAEVLGMRSEYAGIAKDLSYIKGRLEPKT